MLSDQEHVLKGDSLSLTPSHLFQGEGESELKQGWTNCEEKNEDAPP